MVIIPDAQGQSSQKSQVTAGRNSNLSVILADLIYCKNEEDPIKNESARVVKTLNINFSMLNGS